MSLSIDVDTVTAVLLPEAGWVTAGVPATGFEFRTIDGALVSGPVTGILAVKHGKKG